MNGVVFLDRDGTLIEDVPYLGDPNQVTFISRAIDALRLLKAANYKLVLVTNQSGIGRGLITEAQYQSVSGRVTKELADNDIEIHTYWCPHHPTAGLGKYLKTCSCRKPGTGMLEQACQELGLSKKNTHMVGDKASDIGAGERFGAKTALVRTGDGLKTLAAADGLNSDYVGDDLYDVVVNSILI
ncbi:HAD family hydrolase [bacterium]|jgi:D,D-heptose 1,7-bisphosphate phosphatase|nr:HAD family hydrolase [bacterium]